MTSKWIDELGEEIYEDTGFNLGEVSLRILERIDNLLRRARANTNDENLYDEIDKEIRGTE